MSARFASHAGSWYSGKGSELDGQLTCWLNDVNKSVCARAIISPHAGYSYSGSTAAYAYKQIEAERIKRVFILGPSHHVYIPGCALSSVKEYATPLYSMTIDQEIYKDLRDEHGSQFTTMTKEVDEDEHSIELQLPYVAKVMEKCKGKFTIVPVLVGSLKKELEIVYGKIFSKYLKDPENLFVISSDFCHWGQRFKYTYYNKPDGEIYQSIEKLDKMGMDCIGELDPVKFHQYLQQHGNTICGRHPIGVLLNSVEELRKDNQRKFKLTFLNYRQSSKCRHERDSSVSYAAGVLEEV